MAENPQSIEMQLALADILLEKKEYRQAEISYRRVIQNAPNNATALNNLAWLYATSEDTALRDKKRALALSQKAASLKQAPFILDTLAEAYFINGKREKAVQAIDAAIALEPERLDYYLKQKQRFSGEKRRE